jgi:hypothetical protein
METYKTGLKFTHIEDVDKNLAEKIRNIVRLNAKTIHNKDKTFSMRLYQDPENKSFPSVTSVFPKGEELGNWKVSMAQQHGEFKVLTEILKVDINKAEEIIKKYGSGAANFEGARTRNRGSNCHQLVQDTINNKEISFTNTNNKALYKQLYPYLKKIGNIYCVEKQVCSYKLGIAGRTDLISIYKGKLSVIDYKFSNYDRSKQSWYKENGFIQTWVYAHCLEELTGIKIQQCVILVSNEDLTVNEFISDRTEMTSYVGKMREFISNFNKENAENIMEAMNGEQQTNTS